MLPSVILAFLTSLVAPPAWTITPEPVVRISFEADSLATNWIASVGRLHDGRIIVTSMDLVQLLVYDAKGHFLNRIGGKGPGPAEFGGAVGGFTIVGKDEISVDDYFSVKYFRADGHYLRTVARDLQKAFPRFKNLVFTGPMSGGHYFARYFPTHVQRTQGQWRDSVGLVILDSAAGRADSLGVYPEAKQFIGPAQFGGTGPNPTPFCPVAEYVASADYAYIADTDSAAVWAFKAGAGSKGTRIPIPLKRTPVTAADRQAFVTWRKENATPATQKWVDAMLAKAPYPETMPVIDRLVPDSTGLLWVSAYEFPPGKPTHWVVVSPHGQTVATVTLPQGFRVLDIGKDYVLGVWRGEEGIPEVRMYGLRR